MSLVLDACIPPGVEFEVFRKTDKTWQKAVEWFNKRDEKDDSDDSLPDHDGLRERFIVSTWPRNPEGPVIHETPRGKDTGNGCELWGATLYDFYTVSRVPAVPNYLTITTGSRLAAWAKKHGELEWAKEQLRQAELEEDPREIPTYDPSPFIEFLEEQVFKRLTGKPLKGKDRAEVYPEVSDYVRPWPIQPFSTPTIRLQKWLPKSALPRRLIVHDPWNVLLVTTWHDKKEDELQEHFGSLKWTSRRDTVYIYQRKSLVDDYPDYNNDLCPEAHLYITPKRRIGTGHHSFVYQVELALPREMIVKPKICQECEMIEKRKAQEAGNSLKDDEPDLNVQCGPKYCEHLDRGFHPPSMTRVSVCAKISLPNDRRNGGEDHEVHLSAEAKNYESFPYHMFQHWNGYHIMQPLQDPTPAGAVVPQFYGYYVPVPAENSNDDNKEPLYMSPILLLEHCGSPVDAQKLPLSDRQECFSLLRRLHLEGYLHNSVYQRNFLLQSGPLSLPPWKRSPLHPRFRLIDFGRSVKNRDKSAFNVISNECEDARENLLCRTY